MPRPRAHVTDLALRASVHFAGMLPFALLAVDARGQHLTADPIQEITRRTGKLALVFLVASLAVTPLVSASGWHRPMAVRRPLGLYSFAWALLHFLTFAWLDYDLDLPRIWAETTEKRYVLVGFASFCLLALAAATSTRGWQRRLRKGWKQLHRSVYVAALLVVVHFLWLVKADRREPLVWGALVVGLLAARHPRIRRRLTVWRTFIRRHRKRGT